MIPLAFHENLNPYTKRDMIEADPIPTTDVEIYEEKK